MVMGLRHLVSRRALVSLLGLTTGAVASGCVTGPARTRRGSRLPAVQDVGPPAAPIAPAIAPAPAAAKPAAALAPTHAATAHTPTAGGAAISALTKANEMDKHHEDGIKKFPQKTAAQGNGRPPFRMDGNAKVFEITAKKVKWEIEAGKSVDTMAYNGTVPGPEIRVTEGDLVRVIIKNELDESTAIHFHGQRTPNKMDGVPFITQPPIKPGDTFTYEFVARLFGSHMYHSHHNSSVQVPSGLLGAFIVLPKDPALMPKVDREHLMILNDGPHGFTLNGKSFPATQPLVAKVGEKILIRYMNEGSMIHPMHLHGFPQQVIAKDGYPQPPWLCDTLNIAPGER